VTHQISSISRVHEGNGTQINSVYDQTKAGEELENVERWKALPFSNPKETKRQKCPSRRASPGNQQRMRIISNVGARELERMKDNFGHCSAAGPRGEDVPEFM